MKNDNKQKYGCWFLVNQHIFEKEFVAIEQKAIKVFLDFISDKNYGLGIGLFRFDIYIEPKINFGRQADSIYNSCAHLSAHIDKQLFDKVSDDEKLRLLLNASLILVKYLQQRVPLPKDFNAEYLFTDYKEYLKSQSLLLGQAETDQAILKFFDTTRFLFRRTETIEVDKNKIYFDLNEIQDFINNEIAGKTFGQSITAIDFGFELYDFNGGFAPFMKQTENYKRYGTKYKNYLVVKHFDYSEIKNLDEKQQYQLLKEKILEGINDYENLKRKPKDFDKDGFYNIMENILTTYERQKSYY
ncbi:hypothetical protein [Flavobacterium hercynium]|uniref:Uncharacterized protein n=1 Tax=Flavobacterium hercynium TaxID=387094 RepID=A0A226HPI6_9FLAO|nr:hypothetical protein [Flavobacterium hercynium]OXA96115.1 hypothetical protein B0A66_00615 [Flavobacterium hercynium]SMP06039.1 hypothetical protein SAMN06265346_101590 [Flavobacterium hercynium]